MPLRPSPESSPSQVATQAAALPCRVRPALAKDLEAMVGLLGELFGIEEDFVADHSKQRRGLELLLQAPASRLFVAESDGDGVVGMCSCQMLVSTAEGVPAGLVEDVVVRKDMRGRGIGPLLMAAVTDWAREQGATRLQLLADKFNDPALNFYARQGWSSTQLICLRLAPLS